MIHSKLTLSFVILMTGHMDKRKGRGHLDGKCILLFSLHGIFLYLSLGTGPYLLFPPFFHG
jgi:hypothetical protein